MCIIVEFEQTAILCDTKLTTLHVIGRVNCAFFFFYELNIFAMIYASCIVPRVCLVKDLRKLPLGGLI